MDKQCILPQALSTGSKIALVSPASVIDPQVARSALGPLREQGWQPYLSTHALGRYGTYSGTADERIEDIAAALSDTGVGALLCTRGGYGAVHLLDRFPIDKMRSNPRWLIGFSDVSALHAMLFNAGIASLHAPMCRHVGATDAEHPATKALFSILKGELPDYLLPTSPLSVGGNAQGVVVGGNLAVLQALVDTPYNVLGIPDTILFIEDIAEPIYKVERIFYQLRLSGALHRISGLIIGQFTEYRPSESHSDMYGMLQPFVSDLGIPVVFDFPVGHVENNLPMISGMPARLEVGTCTTHLDFGHF
ncbi:LD-carboxypeptidase [uncultured Muribaculum sp.]|uniref:S66 peptidase family protein n=1 Tax=uncultured Muribaculum sp. TaxID=1918613 RepID=UPI0025A9C660|nr:LD-carboxypeptidase [uncultured Muribaculum sp.]